MPQQYIANEPILARRYTVSGYVQGVGFRPFVYRLAQQHAIHGWVANAMGSVTIHAEGKRQALDAFAHALVQQAPDTARPFQLNSEVTRCDYLTEFAIRQSQYGNEIDIHLVPDLPVCEDCLREMRDPANRRYRYPFINCTHCGPRYSLVQQLPYDRCNTSMAGFTLCPDCQREYDDPLDRRFHAEPVACARCGPTLTYEDNNNHVTANEQALQQCVETLRSGGIVAVKGIGGYHLLCDARNDSAVATLRRRKARPHKPLAVMLAEQQLEDYVVTDKESLALLRSRAHPIVLLQARQPQKLSQHIAPGLHEIGVMLPYSPLHHLLLDAFNGPLVVTSANLSGEPVLTRNADVTNRLANVADAYLHHDRDITRPADDPLYRGIAGKPRPLRLGRGNAPLELALPFTLKAPLLATGGHMKNTVALAWQDRIVISPHVGDLHTPRGQHVFEQTITDLQQLYGVNAEGVVCDMHPGYASTRWANKCGLPVHTVQHHHAHAAVLSGEFPHESRWLAFTWDGVGLGSDNRLWGGEALLGNAGQWQRVASMRPFRLPGADRVARQPWRSATALCWHTGCDWQLPIEQGELLHAAWQQQINTQDSSAVGRLFDAAASLLGLVQETSFEGQAPMWLEAAANSATAQPLSLPLQQDDDGIWRCDWQPLVSMLLDDSMTIAERARCLHESLAHTLLQQARQLREQHNDFAIGLCGGVFQNRLLSETAIQLLQQDGFRVYLPEQVPINDAGLCYGQVIEAMYNTAGTTA